MEYSTNPSYELLALPLISVNQYEVLNARHDFVRSHGGRRIVVSHFYAIR
jgi:hypothetical protein